MTDPAKPAGRCNFAIKTGDAGRCEKIASGRAEIFLPLEIEQPIQNLSGRNAGRIYGEVGPAKPAQGLIPAVQILALHPN